MQRLIYVILETEHDENGYIPCIVREGETGYYRTDWHWKCDLIMAKEIAREMNENMGIDSKAAQHIANENFYASMREAHQQGGSA